LSSSGRIRPLAEKLRIVKLKIIKTANTKKKRFTVHEPSILSQKGSTGTNTQNLFCEKTKNDMIEK
jgi:hypothetical protein